MLRLTRFVRSWEEFDRLREKLKLMACPVCREVGTLILHGFLLGFDEQNRTKRTIRARRVFCNNRKRAKGCGTTASVWLAEKVRRLGLSATGLWSFLQKAISIVNKIAAFRQVITGSSKPREPVGWSPATPYRIWKRFERAQSHIRTDLSGLMQLPMAERRDDRHASRRSAETDEPRPSYAADEDIGVPSPSHETITHLLAAFSHEPCPIAAFQVTFQRHFF